MAQMITLIMAFSLTVCAIWTNLLSAMGASTFATVAIGVTVILCCIATVVIEVNSWPGPTNIATWSIPFIASAYAVGSTPTAGGLAWYAMCAGTAMVLLISPRSTYRTLSAMFNMTCAALTL